MKRIFGIVLLMLVMIISFPLQAEAAKVKLNKSTVTLSPGDTTILEVKNTKKKVKWVSKNPKVATVNKNGKVVAQNVGTTKITATVGKQKYVCKVTVNSSWSDLRKFIKTKGKKKTEIYTYGNGTKKQYNLYTKEIKNKDGSKLILSYYPKTTHSFKVDLRIEYYYEKKGVREWCHIDRIRNDSNLRIRTTYDYYKKRKNSDGSISWSAADYGYGEVYLNPATYKKGTTLSWDKYYGTEKHSKKQWNKKLNKQVEKTLTSLNKTVKKNLGHTLKDFGFQKFR